MDQDNLLSYAHTAEEWTSYVHQNGLSPLFRYNSMKQTIESQTITNAVRLKASRDFELSFMLTEKLVTHLHRYNSHGGSGFRRVRFARIDFGLLN